MTYAKSYLGMFQWEKYETSSELEWGTNTNRSPSAIMLGQSMSNAELFLHSTGVQNSCKEMNLGSISRSPTSAWQASGAHSSLPAFLSHFTKARNLGDLIILLDKFQLKDLKESWILLI